MMNNDATDAVRRLEKESGAKVKFIHVVRNPFDNIATMTLQHRKIKGREGEHEIKVSVREIKIFCLQSNCNDAMMDEIFRKIQFLVHVSGGSCL